MEEVDSIILQFLRQLNINIDDEAKSISDLPVETIIKSASICISKINNNINLPKNFASNVSHRIEIAAQIASACKDLGYKNDVGYQTFLYHNESELRQVFMFLIESLPTEGKQATSNPTVTNKKSQLLIDIANKISEELNSVWIPPSCNKLRKETIGDNNISDSHGTRITRQSTYQSNCIKENLLEKFMKLKCINSNDKPLQANSLGLCIQDQDLMEPKKQQEIKETLKELKEKAIVLRQKLSTLESERNIMNTEYNQAHRNYEKANHDYTNVQNIMSGIGINIDTDDIPENLLVRLQESIDKLHSKSEKLTSKNLEIKMDIENMKASNLHNQSERSKCKNILLSLRDSAKSMKEEYALKEQQLEELKEKYGKLKSGSKRAIYTKRILEIIGNVDKQNLEIKKILDDTRELQKEINSLEGQLDRCFSIADETLFADAKRDDQAKRAYKLLALLHSECSTIISLVNDTGASARDIVDLEDNIKTEQAKKTEDTLTKIQMDLKQLQESVQSH